MKRWLLFVMILSLQFTAQAASNISFIKFGASGPRGENYPIPNSGKDAERIFRALSVPDLEARKTVETRDGILVCGDFGLGQRKAYICEFVADNEKTKLVKISANEVEFGGKIAQKLWDSLAVSVSSTRTHSIKLIANLSCSKSTFSPSKVKCTFTDVDYYEI